MNTARGAVAALLLLVTPVARGQTTERAGAEPRVVLVGRGAQAQGPDGSWKDLERDDVVVIGAGVKGGAGTVLRWQDGPLDVGELVALDPGAQVTITGDRQLDLVAGACFFQVNARLEVGASWGKVELAGDARVEVERGGTLKVLATTKVCIVQASGARQEVPAGQTASIGADGAVQVSGGRPLQVPAWLARLWRLDPRAIVYVQDLSRASSNSSGAFAPGCLTGAPAGGWPSLVSFGEWRQGLHQTEQRLTVRCQLRLSAPTLVTMMIGIRGHPNVFDRRTLVRGGEVTEVEFDLEAFRSPEGQAPPVGETVVYFTIMAGQHDSKEAVQLELRRLVVFRRDR